MGVIGRYPFALAAGLGLNGVVAFQLASQMSWPAAMGIVVLEGLVITALVLTGVRQSVFDAVPLALKNAIADGSAQIVPGQPVNPRGWSLNVPKWPSDVVSTPDFGLIGHFSLGGSFA